MKAPSLPLTLAAVIVAPLALALTAFVSGLWQRSHEPILREEELGI